MPVASAFARLVAVLVAPLAVLRALERVRLAVLREVLRLRVAAAFLAEARRCVWVWVAIELAILPGRSGFGADLRLLDLTTVEVYLGRRFVTHAFWLCRCALVADATNPRLWVLELAEVR